jgi:CheY-like chemotaxis protein
LGVGGSVWCLVASKCHTVALFKVVVRISSKGEPKVVRSQRVEILLVESGDQETPWLRDAFEETGLIHIVRVVPHVESALVALRGPDRVSPSLIILNSQADSSQDEEYLARALAGLGELKSDADLRSIPVVIVTDNNVQADVLNAYSHGASSFVSKPETKVEQRTLISRFSEYWVHVAELPWGKSDPSALPVRTFEELAGEYHQGGNRPVEVLVVDDSENDVVLLQEAFRDCPMVEFVGVVEDGDQALRFLRQEGEFENSRRPSVVLMDINMPRKNGFEVLTEMQADSRLSNVPVVMLTTSKQESDILRAYASGACSFIAKPVNFDAMKAVARHFALYWALVADLPQGEDPDPIAALA